MMLLNKYLRNPRYIMLGFMRHFPYLFTDKLYIKLGYRLNMGIKLNLKNPVTFTEKLQWLKLYDRRPEYTAMVDKIEVKKQVVNMIGEEYIIPTLGVWDDANDIDFNQLPDQFVLKCNHTGGGNVFICKDKSKFDFKKIAWKLNKQLKTDVFMSSREWPYKNVNRKIICEKYMEDESGELKDYKFYCFNGEPKVLLIASNRFTSHNFDYFDMSYEPLFIVSDAGPKSGITIKKPLLFNEMKNIASCLSRDIPHVRVDLYYSGNKIYFGELTFFDSSGYDGLSSDEWNTTFGSWIKLPEK